MSLWLRDEKNGGWHRAAVVSIGKQASGSCDVQVRITEGPQAKLEKTLSLDVRALENEEVHDIMLANSSDMVKFVLSRIVLLPLKLLTT